MDKSKKKPLSGPAEFVKAVQWSGSMVGTISGKGKFDF